MQNIINHVALPNNDVGVWSEYDNIDFTLEFQNRAIMTDTIRFEADIQIYSDDGQTRLAPAEDIHLDPKVGGHSVIQSINTVLSNIGNIENLNDYNRLVAMRATARHTDDDMMNSRFVSELRAPGPSIQALQCLQKCPKIFGGGGAGLNANAINDVLTDPDFSLKLEFCLNNVVGGSKINGSNVNISYSQSGAIRIGLILERNLGVLYGRDASNLATYTLTNVRMRFMTAPDQAPKQVQLNTSLSIKQSLESQFNNLSCQVPAVSNAVSMSFQESMDEYTAHRNNLQLVEPPNIDQVSYLFNDSTNKFITFQIKHRVEMLSRALDSLNSNKSNSYDLTKLSSNNGYLLGLNWGTAISLSNQKFNIQLSTGITNSPYVMYSYFHAVVVV